MDKQLLQALDNLSYGLEVLVETLKEKGAKSDTGKALQSGNFEKPLEAITVELKSIKKDTQEILKNQQTIISLQKQKSGDKKGDPAADASKPKKESQIKKGVSTILLIAVAVLAIGLAFKLVGKIDFLSVIALGAAIYLVSMAFEKVAKLKMSIKEAAIASATMVLMAIAVTLSSFVLQLIIPISAAQLFTGIAITAMFYIMVPKFISLLEIISRAGRKISYGDIIKATVILVAMSVVITLSSWVLRLITPLSIGQLITGIGITSMFYVVSNFLPKLAISIVAVSKIMTKKDLILMPIMLVGFAIAITLSSFVLKLIMPMSFSQIITGIAITTMFWIVSNFLPRLALAVIAVSKIMSKKDLPLLPLILVAFSIAIMLSSYVLSIVKPLSFGQIITTIVITAVFWAISKFLPDIAIGVLITEKLLGKGKMFLIPLIYIALSTAIMVSGFLFSKTPELSFKQMLGILLIGLIFAGLAYVMPEIAVGLVLMDKALGKGKMFLIPLVFIAIATAIMISSHILNASAEIPWMKLLNILVLSIVLVIAIGLLGLVTLFLVKVVGVKNVLKGSVAIVALALVIMLSSLIISKGTYKKYPDWKWSLFVGLSIAVFGAVAWLLTKLGGVTTYIKGGIALLIVAATVMATSHILNIGNYKNYPKLKWSIGVGASLLGFGVAMGVLGLVVSSGIGLVVLAAGAVGVLLVAGTIVAASHVLAKGKYSAGKYPSLGWSLGVGLALTAFGGGMVLLGGMIIASFGIGGLMLKAGSNAVLQVARTIVKSSHILAKGTWKKGPTTEWATGVAIALGAFAPVYKMLMANQIMKLFGGGGVGPKEFSTAIKTVSQGIVDAAGFFAKNKAAFINGPSKDWSLGVGLAIGAFAPVYKMLVDFPFTGGKKMSKAIVTISKGIVESAGIFAKNKATFEGGYPTKEWGLGVGAALGAFAPVFKALSKDTGWFTSGDQVINNMVNGIVKIAKAIVRVANIFSYSKANWEAVPTKKWSWNVKNAVGSFIRLVKSVTKGLQYDTIVGIVSRMSEVSRILSQGKFSLKIQPNYFKTVGKNIIDFNNVVKKIAQSENGAKLGSSIFGNDPITRVAKRMVMLSKSYDALAKSLMRLGAAMKMVKGLQQLGPKGMPGGGSKDSGEVKSIRQETTSSFGRNEVGAPIKSKRMMGPEDKKNQISYVSAQLEKVVKILTNIDKSTSTIDEYLSEYIEGQSGNIGAPAIEA